MKKVLVVSESKSVWGAERSLLKLAGYAKDNAVKLDFLIADASPLARDLESHGFSYKHHKFAPHPALHDSGSLSNARVGLLVREVLSVLKGAVRVWRQLRGYDSILVFSIWQAPEIILGSWLARTPVDIDLHETFSNGRAMKLVGLISRLSRQVLVPSKVLALRSGLTHSHRVSVIPRPVDVAVASSGYRTIEADSPMTVGVFGQIQPHKNVLEVVKAVGATRVPIRLLIVGGEPVAARRSQYESEVRKEVANLPHNSAVVDAVPRVAHLMKQCQVVVNASDHEAFGRTIIEAVAVGSYPVSVGDWGPRETISLLGVGSSVDKVDDLRNLFADLKAKCAKGPLLPSVPRTIADYEASAVARRYFRRISSPNSTTDAPSLTPKMQEQ